MEMPAIKTGEDVKALAKAFDAFTKSTLALEESYRLLESRAHELSDKLAAKNRELELTSDYLNNILESMSDGVIAVDTDGVVTKFNRGAAVILGFAAEECVGRPFRDLFGREFSPATAAGNVLRSRAGEAVCVAERDTPIAGRDRPCIGFVKVFQDLTEIASLRERVQRMDRLAAVGQMAATVAHEIRNPLGGIRGFASLLARDIPPEDPRARLVEKVLIGVGSLDKVVNDLLEYTRPVELRLRAVACRELVNAAIACMAPEKASAIRVSIRNGVKVMADQDRMGQVLLNIFINAFESMEGGGAVNVSARADAGSVEIAISDSGCGIPAEVLGKVFSPFFSTKEKGSGLGLAVAAKIVEGHVGTIKVESEPGKGSTFIIALPRAE
jgi:PAS domain S-box-containing protein